MHAKRLAKNSDCYFHGLPSGPLLSGTPAHTGERLVRCHCPVSMISLPCYVWHPDWVDTPVLDPRSKISVDVPLSPALGTDWPPQGAASKLC